jgi:hypothetical protein
MFRDILNPCGLAMAIASAVIALPSAARAQAGVNPDGSMWVNTGGTTTWTNPAGSAKVDKEGHVVDVKPNCTDVTSVNVQQAKSVCWKVGDKYMVFEVGYVLYTCFDSGASVARRITTYVQATGRSCDPADEAIDRGNAQIDWQETWTVPPTFPPPIGGGDTGGGTQTGTGTQTGSGDTGGGTQTGGDTQTGGGTKTTETGGGQPSTGGPLIGGWPPGADWIKPTSTGGWIIHYPDGHTVEKGPDSKVVEQTPSGQQTNAQPSTGTTTTGTGDTPAAGGKVESPPPPKSADKTETKTKTEVKKSARPRTATGTTKDQGNNNQTSNGQLESAIGLGVGVGLGMGMGMGHGMRGGDDRGMDMRR